MKIDTSLESIAEVTADFFSVPVESVTKGRTRREARMRHIFNLFATTKYGHNDYQVGRFLKRDHSTCNHTRNRLMIESYVNKALYRELLRIESYMNHRFGSSSTIFKEPEDGPTGPFHAQKHTRGKHGCAPGPTI